ncbi:MAG TPA: hypothetical protein VG488_00895 [Candidatus Angelobacter sp.]|jgi:hypothetical protein|nr:hypothetical protein [Candidatus Angelobacter sp.]
MADTRVHLAGLSARNSSDSADEHTTPDKPKASFPAATDLQGKCMAVAPDGSHIPLPKELFVALTDFMQSRKCPGSITIQFRNGEITCVEAVAKKTFRNP